MLSIFPVHFLAPVAYTILRLCVGGVLFYVARTHVRHRTSFAQTFARIPLFPFGGPLLWLAVSLELIAGTLLIVGLFTQIGALIALLYAAGFLLFHSHLKHPRGPSRSTLLLILCAALSLFITGPGIFAFDLPI